MNGFDPGEGWREVQEPATSGEGDEVRWRSSDDLAVRYWVREVPVSPLPTEPYTVIRVTWAKGARKGAEDMLVNYLGGWCDLEGTIYTRPDVASGITGFEVLAEPRAVTAKAVLDAAADFFDITWTPSAAADIAREFGVSS